jgi:hypothetical protein
MLFPVLAAVIFHRPSRAGGAAGDTQATVRGRLGAATGATS